MSAEPEKAPEIEVLPPETSMTGINSLYHHCDAVGHQQSYAVCLHILLAIDENRIRSDQFVDCQRARCHGSCHAATMREEERVAKKALYYKPRTNINPNNTRSEREAQENALRVSSGKFDMNNPSFARGWNSVGATKGEKVTRPVAPPRPVSPRPLAPPRPAPQPKSGFVEENMADLVNAMVKSETSEHKELPSEHKKVSFEHKELTSSSTIKPMPGETPLEFARRRAALLKSQ